MGEEPNHTTARKPGPLEIIHYSLERPVVNEREGEYTDKKEMKIFLIYCIRKFIMEQLQSHI